MKISLYEIVCELGGRKENQCNTKVRIVLESIAVCADGETVCVQRKALAVK